MKNSIVFLDSPPLHGWPSHRLMPDTEVVAGDQVWKLSLGGIPSGMYILEVHSDRQQWREKIVVR